MKTFKILFAAVIIAGFATTAMANDPITASANVIDEIEFVAGDAQDMNFGVLRVGQNKILTLQSDGSVEASGAAGELTTGIQPGIVAFTVGLNANITINFSAAGDITDDLDAQYNVFWNNEGGTPGDNQFVTTASNGNTTFSTTTEKIWVYVDGQIDATGAEVGAYQDDLTITAEYN